MSYDYAKDPPLKPRKAMRIKCLDCCAGSTYEVKHCGISDCPLWPYRMGRGICTNFKGIIGPARKISPERLEVLREMGKRLNKSRNKP